MAKKNGKALATKKSIQDVAACAGVSIATVSRTFQYPDRVAKKTRDIVNAAARDLNYAPNAHARSLRTSKTSLIVAMIPDVTNPFFAEIIRGIEKIAKRNGYSLLLGDTQNVPENEQRYGDMVSTRQVDGMLTLIQRVPDIRREGQLPVVNACEPVDDPNISSVLIDNVASFREGVSYLTALGHKHIAFVSGPSKSCKARRQGFDEAIEAAGLTVPSEHYQSGDFSIEAGRRAANLILSFGHPLTAFACVSDQLAIGVIQALKDHGLSVPGDVSVLGFDDIAFARYTDPPLSTVAQPKEEIGSEAMIMLLQHIENPTLPARKVILPTQLIIRGTTAPPR